MSEETDLAESIKLLGDVEEERRSQQIDFAKEAAALSRLYLHQTPEQIEKQIREHFRARGLFGKT